MSDIQGRRRERQDARALRPSRGLWACGRAGSYREWNLGRLGYPASLLYKIDGASAFEGQSASTAVIATVKLGGRLKGSFVDFDGTSVFIGSYEKDTEKAKGHFLPLSVFDTHNNKTVNEIIAVRTISIPVEAQGAAFDMEGNLWISASSSKFGTLYKLDAKRGRLLSSYDMVIGIEDLAFDDEGSLWSVSEAGSIRWQKWGKTYPLLFRIDLNKLR